MHKRRGRQSMHANHVDYACQKSNSKNDLGERECDCWSSMMRMMATGVHGFNVSPDSRLLENNVISPERAHNASGLSMVIIDYFRRMSNFAIFLGVDARRWAYAHVGCHELFFFGPSVPVLLAFSFST